MRGKAFAVVCAVALFIANPARSIYAPDSIYHTSHNNFVQYNYTTGYVGQTTSYGPAVSFAYSSVGNSPSSNVKYGNGFTPAYGRGPSSPEPNYGVSTGIGSSLFNPGFGDISGIGGALFGSSNTSPPSTTAVPGSAAPERPPLGAGCVGPSGPCVNSKYRTIDGTCNNLRFPNWGAANTRYGRLVPSKYADGVSVPPVSVVNGNPLPLARLISIVMFPDLPLDDPIWTLVTMSWGQVITHDMSMAIGTTQAKRHSTRCCGDDGQLRQNNNPQCFPIILPPDDPTFARYRRNCMNFVRSSSDLETGCNDGSRPAEQLVAVTHWMDASLVYGATLPLSDSLRERVGGRLLVEIRAPEGRPFPPMVANKTAVCDIVDQREPCYQLGDRRGNQNTQLTVLQIILLREHNRIATILSQINPHWNDETLFQEARRILIAEYQHINYMEYLPIILGSENMIRYRLISQQRGYSNDYNENVDPSVLNGHATAAFRYFHSAIQGFFQLLAEGRNILNTARLSDFFNRPVILEQGNNFDHLTRGLSTQSQEQVDPFFTSEITEFLFRAGRPFGRDLRAIDIQRGRDHGLGSYNDYREFCGLPRARSWQDFGDFIDAERISKLSNLYAHPDDVDFTVGGSLEAHSPGTLAGPTFLCILLEQFYRTRVSDRYFYDLGGQPGSFSPVQLREIKKASLARIFCDNSDGIQSMQPSAFLKVSAENALSPCNDYGRIPSIDLSLWREIPPQGAFSFDFKK